MPLPTGLCSVLSLVPIKFKCVDSCALYRNTLSSTSIQIDVRKYSNTTTEEHSRSLAVITRYCRSRILKFDSCTLERWSIWGYEVQFVRGCAYSRVTVHWERRWLSTKDLWFTRWLKLLLDCCQGVTSMHVQSSSLQPPPQGRPRTELVLLISLSSQMSCSDPKRTVN